jgi:thioredoxin-dependent peroxiredoxin
MIEEGDQFPDFSLQDQEGKTHSLGDLTGAKSVIYFYPKDDTPGCTVEACNFRDSLPKFEGVKVFGVSPDDAKSHKKFEQKFNLNFPLLADTDKALTEELGLWVEKSMYGKKYMGVDRTTYLLDANGKIEKIWRKVKVEGHADEVLAAV